MPLSVIIITKNEEANLPACLESVRFADEIVVVDSGSSDKTVEVAKGVTENVYSRPFDDFSLQKNYALSKATSEWVLSVDADERVSPELAEELRMTMASSTSYEGYKIPRQTYFLGKRMRFSGMQDDRPLRFFKRTRGKFIQPIHEFVEIKGDAGRLQSPLLHYTTKTIQQELNKTEFYTQIEAQFLLKKGIQEPACVSVLRGAAVFIQHYFFKRGFLDGKEGFLYAFYAARYTMRKYSKLKELRAAHDLEPLIKTRFDKDGGRLPDWIDRADSRLNALLNAMGPLAGKKVLDVGCGKGRFAAVVAEKGGLVTGIDPSETLINEAKKQKGGVFLQASAISLPFNNESFDMIYAVEVVEHLPSPAAGIEEMTRVLKPGGKLLIIDRNVISLSQRRFPIPNVLIKTWHEIKNDWFYPRNFPFREKWFMRSDLIKMMKSSGLEARGDYILSDGEKKCIGTFLFKLFPFLRIFILWQGVKK